MEAKVKVSRVGRLPVTLPDGVKAELNDQELKVSGKLGSLTVNLHSKIAVEVSSDSVIVKPKDDHRKTRALHGLTRALVGNMVTGVSEGFERKLTLIGVGYRASVKGSSIQLEVGKSHEVLIPIPDGIEAEVTKKQDEITLRGIDKAKIGQFAADLRRQRPVEPYKGKGIRYAGEYIKLKAGKKAGKK